MNVEIYTAQPPAQIAFDYSELEPTVAQDARALAEQVRAFERKTAAGMFDIGRDLLGIKERLGHGNFGNWLRAEFSEQERSMQRYMTAALAFPGESDTVSVLPISTVHVLAAKTTPEPVRIDIVERLKRGETLPPKAIGSIVKQARRVAEDASRDAKLTETQRKDRARRAAREKADTERHRRDWQEKTDRHAAARDAAAMIIVSGLPDDRLDDLITLLNDGLLRGFAEVIASAKAAVRQRALGGMSIVEVMREAAEEALSNEETTP